MYVRTTKNSNPQSRLLAGPPSGGQTVRNSSAIGNESQRVGTQYFGASTREIGNTN